MSIRRLISTGVLLASLVTSSPAWALLYRAVKVETPDGRNIHVTGLNNDLYAVGQLVDGPFLWHPLFGARALNIPNARSLRINNHGMIAGIEWMAEGRPRAFVLVNGVDRRDLPLQCS